MKLHGIIPPLITPLKWNNERYGKVELDEQSTKTLIDKVINGQNGRGVNGVFLLGSTGEAPSLSCQLRKDFVELACRIIDGRVPVLVGVSDTCMETTVDLAIAAKQSGATALVLTSPYYFHCSQEDLLRYVDDFVRHPAFLRSGQEKSSLLPILLYNMPDLTKVKFEIATVRHFMTEYNAETIVGIKDSSGDIEYFSHLCRLRDELRPNGDWSVFMGPDHLASKSLAVGGDGVIPSGANIKPDLFMELYDAACRLRNGEESAEEVEARMAEIRALTQIYSFGQWFIATKCACFLLQTVQSDTLAPPFRALTESQRSGVKKILDSLPERS